MRHWSSRLLAVSEVDRKRRGRLLLYLMRMPGKCPRPRPAAWIMAGCSLMRAIDKRSRVLASRLLTRPVLPLATRQEVTDSISAPSPHWGLNSGLLLMG